MSSLRLNISAATALLWKELRSTLLLVAMLGVTVLVLALVGWTVFSSGGTKGDTLPEVLQTLMLTLFPIAAGLLLGANAFATERFRNTEHFLDSLPVSRLMTALVKVLAGVSWVAVPIIFAQILATQNERSLPYWVTRRSWTWAGYQGALFGLALLASSLSRAPLRAVFVALLHVPVFCVFVALTAFSGLFHAWLWGIARFSVVNTNTVQSVCFLMASPFFLAVPFILDRDRLSRRRAVLAVLCAAGGALLMALPLAQLLLWWGRDACAHLAGRQDKGWLVLTAIDFSVVLSLLFVAAALLVHVRRWTVERVAVRAEGAALSFVLGGALLVLPFWVAHYADRYPERISGLSFFPSPEGGRALALAAPFARYYRETSSGGYTFLLPYPTPGVLLEPGARKATDLRSQVLGLPEWSPDRRFIAWLELRGGLLAPVLSIAVRDPSGGLVGTADLPGDLTDHILRPSGYEGLCQPTEMQFVWSEDSSHLFYLMARRDGPVREGRTVCTKYQIYELPVRAPQRGLSTLARWEKCARVLRGYREQQPQLRAGPDSGRLYIFDSLDDDAQSLFRIEVSSGEVKDVEAFTALKRRQKRSRLERARERGTTPLDKFEKCYALFWRHARDIPEIPLVFYFSFSEREPVTKYEARLREYWILQDGGGPPQLLRLAATPYAFLDSRTYVAAKRRADPETTWDILKCRVGEEEPTVLATIDDASPYEAIKLSASGSGRWLAVSAEMSDAVPRETGKRKWILSADGSVPKLVGAGSTRSWARKTAWAQGAPDLYWLTHEAIEGVWSYRLHRASERSGWETETIPVFQKLREDEQSYVSAYDFYATPTDVWLCYRAVRSAEDTEERVDVIARVDFETKQIERILELDPRTLTWRGLNGWTVEVLSHE